MTATASTSTPTPDPAAPAGDRRAAGWGEVAGRFFDAAPDGMAVVDAASGEILDANPAFCAFLGRSRDALAGLTLNDVTPEEDRAAHADEALHRTRETPVPLRREQRFLRGDGSLAWAAITLTPLPDAPGGRQVNVAVIEDLRRRPEPAPGALPLAQRWLLEQVPAAVFIHPLDPNSPPTYISPRIEAITGYRPDELMGERHDFLAPFVHPEDSVALRPLGERTDRTLEPFVADYRLRRKDGRWIWLHNVTEVVRDDDGTPLHWQGYVEDVTARREAEDALRSAEALYRGLVEQVPAVVYTLPLDPDAPPLFVSPKIEALTGHTPAEASRNRTFLRDFVHPDDLAANLPIAQESDRTLRPCVMRYRIRHADGRWIWLLDTSEVVRDERGDPLWWQGVLVDITAEKRLQEDLAASEARFRSVFEAGGVGMALMSPDGTLLDVNPTLCRSFGYDRAELIGHAGAEFMHPDDLALEQPEIARMRAGEIDRYGREKRYRHRDGHWVWSHVDTTCVRDEAGEIALGVAIVEDISPRKAAERALADSEALFRSSFERAAIGMAISDADGLLTDANPAFCQLLGYARDELVGMDFAAITHPDDLAREAAEHQRMAAGEIDRYRMDKRFLRRDGRAVWTSVNGATVRGPDGAIVRGIAQVEDISARKAAEQALAESEARFRSTFENAAIGMAIATSGGLLVDVNPAFCRLLGHTRDELLAMDFAAFTHPDDLAREMAEVHRLRAGEADHYRLDKRYIRKDGSVAWVNFTGSCVRGPGGEIALAIGQAEDITARREAEAALAESEEMFRTTVHQSRVATGIADAAGRFIDANESLSALTGYGRGELLGMAFADLGHPDDNAPEQALFREVLAGTRSQWVVEKRLLRKDGSVLWAWVNVSAVRGADGGVERLIGQVVDVTAVREAQRAAAEALELQRAANEELVRLARQRAEFLAMLAHDVRTPLTAIQGYADLLLLDSGDQAAVREYAATISGSAERLNRMVTDMLAIETMEARLGQLRLAPTDVAALVADAVAALHGAWPDRDIETSAEPGLPEAALDRDQVTQAVFNLVGNALKYSPGGEPVSVTVRRDGPAIEIAVTDRGIGIPADKLERVFDTYARIRTRETAGIEGVGLGLPIVRAIARAHGGEAWAESEPGAGSTFRLRLPVAPAAGNGTDA